MTRHKPDYEMEIMRRGLRDLASLPPAGRQRVLDYLVARAPTMPQAGEEEQGEQQLDIDDAGLDIPPRRSAAAAA